MMSRNNDIPVYATNRRKSPDVQFLRRTYLPFPNHTSQAPGTASRETMDTFCKLNLKNTTDKSYHFVVCQGSPVDDLRSLAWKALSIPPASTSSLVWRLSYGVAILKWDPEAQIYSGQQIRPAELGGSYEVRMTAGDTPDISPCPADDGDDDFPDMITLTNNTNQKLDLGFVVDGSLIAVASVEGGESTMFYKHQTYSIVCYNHSVEEGELMDVDEEAVVYSVEVEFENADYTDTAYTVEAVEESGRFFCRPPELTSFYDD